MNSTEEIAKYSDNNSHYRSPTLARRAGVELDEPCPEKPAKKDKKWSLGGLFRRKKKEIESESTSDDDAHAKRGFLQRRKQKKEDKRKKRSNKALGHFDHIVVTPGLQNNITNGNKEHDESGVLSDPTAGFASYIRGNSTRITGSTDRISSRESLSKNRQDLNQSRGSLGSGSLDSSGKKSRREKVKARVEAMRDRMKNDSSSDEGSQRSTASSITKFKSDDSLSKKESASSRKTRSARTERYIKRLTKEDENVLNKEAELETQRIKSDVDVHQSMVPVNRWTVVDELPRSPPTKPVIKPTLNYSASNPLPQKPFIGISTIPPSHNVIHRTNSNLSDNQRNYYNASHKPTNIYPTSFKSNATDLRNTPKHYPKNENRNDFSTDQRSFSYDCNINCSPTPNEGEIIHVQFPIGKPIPKPRNPNMINHHPQHYPNQSLQRITPPPPPPRDLQRRIYPNVQYENTRPMSYAFENGNQSRHGPGQKVDRSSSVRSFNAPPPTSLSLNRVQSLGWQSNYRSNSEDHIAQSNQAQQDLITRPASASPDTTQQRFIRRHPNSDQYKYFAEKTPRSRRPIHIASTQPDQTYLSDSQVITRSYPGTKHPVQAASEFWRQKDMEEVRRKSQLFEANKDKIENKIQPASPVVKKLETKDIKKNFSVLSIPVKTADSLSSLSGNSDTSPLCTKPFFELNNETNTRPLSMVLEKAEHQDDASKSKKDPPAPPIRRYSRQSSASSTENNWMNDAEEVEKRKRRSSNLEDALDELEAIYKSLRLGDEDLLDRAERRDVPPAVTQKLLTKMPDTYVNWGASRGAQSDSGYNYDIDTVDAQRRKQTNRRSAVPDRVNDDMAYRRLNKERPPPLDINAAMSQVSYLLATPLLGSAPVDENDNESATSNNEPDITLDDVVYRNLKHSNNTLKIVDPQPPFGIPVGPITTASNSDYLHAVPENRTRSRFIPQKSPDIVKDDLAFRSLRKDQPGATDDILNNNTNKSDFSLKKKRAVRSISANIYNMMHRDTMKAAESSENEFDKAQSLTDIADVMDVAHQILKDKQRKISRKSAVSDTETKPMRCNFMNSNIPTSTETLTESKSNLLNEINLSKDNDLKQRLQVYIPLSLNDATINQKPPLCPTPDRKSSRPPTKETTPIRVSPALEDNAVDKSQLEDLLTALAIEARETSEKLGNDLKLLDEQESRKCSPLKDLETSTTEMKSSDAIKTLDQKLSDIDAVSEHAKLCEKLLGCVVESTNLIGQVKPEVSATKESEINEIVDDIPDEPVIYKSVANVVVTRKSDTPSPTIIPKLETPIESDHDYENINKEEDISASPFEEHKTQLVADFEELKKDLFSDETSVVSNKLDDKTVESKDNSFQCTTADPKTDDSTFRQLQDESCSEGEVCRAVDCLAYNSHDAEFDFSNEILLNPPLAFSTSAEIEIFDKSDSHSVHNHEINQNYIHSDSLGTKLNNNIPNFSPLPSPEIEYETHDHSDLILANFAEVIQNYTSLNSKTDSEHSSGFHTESHGSSSADSSLNPILNDLDLHEFHNLSTLETEQIFFNNLLLDSFNSTSDQCVSANCSTESNPNDLIKCKESELLNDLNKYPKSLATSDLSKSTLKSDDEPVKTYFSNPIKPVHDPCEASNDQSIPSTSTVDSNVPTNPSCSSSMELTRRSSADDAKDTLDSLPVAWYRDPATIALACSYTLAFVHQLAVVDIVTLLGLLLAIISVFAALVL